MAQRVSPNVVHDVVHASDRRAGGERRGNGGSISRRPRSPSYLVYRRGVYFFQIRVPNRLAACKNLPPIRVRLGRLPARQARQFALRLRVEAEAAFETRKRQMEMLEHIDPPQAAAPEEAGYPIGSDGWLTLMHDILAEGLVRLQHPAPDDPTPETLRGRAALQEAVMIEQEARKGSAGNPTVIARAELLRQDVWRRWRAGEGLAPADDSLSQAIGRLADAAERQLQVLAAAGSTSPAISRSPTIHLPPPAPPAAAQIQGATAGVGLDARAVAEASAAPRFSVIESEYLAMRDGAGAGTGTLSTIALRARIFRELMNDRPFDAYRPKDLQDYVNLLQYLPVEYTRAGPEHDALQNMKVSWLVERNKSFRCWEPLALKTLQDGYIQTVKTIFAHGVTNHRFQNPFAAVRIRWPDNAKPSVRREALDYEKLNVAFSLGVQSGYIDEAILLPLGFLSTRRFGLLAWLRGTDVDQKHGCDIVRMNGIVFDKASNCYRRVPYKSTDSLRFFVLHNWFRDVGFTQWAQQQGDGFIFRPLHLTTDPADTASKRVNRQLARAGARGMNIEVGHSIRHGAKNFLIDEGVDSEAAHLQMGHNLGDVHSAYGQRDELRRRQCQELSNLPLPPEIDWKIFEGLDFEAMAAKLRVGGRPKKGKI